MRNACLPLAVSGLFLTVNPLFLSRADANRLPGYAMVNLHAQQRLARDWRLRLRLENLFDKDYLLAYGYNTQARAAFVQLPYQLPGGARP